MTSTHIGTWAVDKLIRFALLPRGGQPVVWDFGSAAEHHVLYNPWLDHGSGARDDIQPEHGSRAGISTLRGAFHPDAGIAEGVAKTIKRELEKYGLAHEPLGVDVVEIPILLALKNEGIDVVDGQQVFLEARRIKTEDEVSLLASAASMVDAAYDELYGFLRPGVRENECVVSVSKVLYDLGSEHVEGVNAISGERCSPTRTSSRIGFFAQGTPRSSTSCTPSMATARAITARSRWVRRRWPNVTRTPNAARSWITPSTS